MVLNEYHIIFEYWTSVKTLAKVDSARTPDNWRVNVYGSYSRKSIKRRIPFGGVTITRYPLMYHYILGNVDCFGFDATRMMMKDFLEPQGP